MVTANILCTPTVTQSGLRPSHTQRQEGWDYRNHDETKDDLPVREEHTLRWYASPKYLDRFDEEENVIPFLFSNTSTSFREHFDSVQAILFFLNHMLQ